jgi:hypothetical protein
VRDTVNADLSFTPGPEGLPSGGVEIVLHRRDPRQDMIYEIVLTDRTGNVVVQRDTIGGFTVAAVDFAGDTVGLRWGRSLVGDTLVFSTDRCDSVVLTNYGKKPLPITTIWMRGNISFSIPPAQLPLVIPPGEQVAVMLCIQGLRDSTMIDTVVIANGCGLIEEVQVEATVTLVRGLGTDYCNNAITVEQHAASKRTFMQPPVPNPAEGATATVDIGMAQEELVAFEIFSATGEPALTVMRGVELPAGINRVTFDISELDAGAYFCRLTTATGAVHLQKMIVAR